MSLGERVECHRIDDILRVHFVFMTLFSGIVATMVRKFGVWQDSNLFRRDKTRFLCGNDSSSLSRVLKRVNSPQIMRLCMWAGQSVKRIMISRRRRGTCRRTLIREK